jgi:hypothetical protein
MIMLHRMFFRSGDCDAAGNCIRQCGWFTPSVDVTSVTKDGMGDQIFRTDNFVPKTVRIDAQADNFFNRFQRSDLELIVLFRVECVIAKKLDYAAVMLKMETITFLNNIRK